LFPDPIHTVDVQAFCTFAVWDWKVTRFRPEDHKARFIVHAVKGDRAKLAGKYQDLTFGTGQPPVRIDETNFELVTDAWAKWAVGKIRARKISGPIVLAPLPTSKAVPALANYRTRDLARLVQAHLGGASTVWDGVRFREERQPVHGGGNRATITEDMVLVSEPPDGEMVVLDDVFTTGAHLSALVRHLPTARRPNFMVTAGQTVWERPEDVFKRPVFVHSVYP
jgi:hypothetical protein